jgi:GMP synthase (glutamine-hydrolysing)
MRITVVNNERNRDDYSWLRRVREALVEIAPVMTIVVFWSDVSLAGIDQGSDGIILAGRVSHDWDMEEMKTYQAELELIRGTRRPLLGICAGHQLIALAYGGEIGLVKVINGQRSQVKGYLPCRVVKGDPLFQGLGGEITALEFHSDEVKSVPPDLEVLASGEACRVQVIRHRTRPVYGVQFHPEWHNPAYPDGRVLLANFLEMVKG